MTILDQIIINKKKEVQERMKINSIQQLKNTPLFSKTKISLSESLLSKSEPPIIAEFKRKSPSKGYIQENANPLYYAEIYERNKVAGMSILTDEKYFGAQDRDFELIRNNCQLPILRKEFIINEYQIYESKAMGADAILLIAKILTINEMRHFITIARDLDLEVIVEFDNEKDLQEKYLNDINIVGINNRNLETFKVDFDNSERLFDLLPADKIKIAESGISKIEHIKQLSKIGFNGFLIGSEIMKHPNPDQFLKELLAI